MTLDFMSELVPVDQIGEKKQQYKFLAPKCKVN